MDTLPQTEQPIKKATWQILVVSFFFFISGLLMLIGSFINIYKTGVTLLQLLVIFEAIASLVVAAALPRLKKWAFWLTLIFLLWSVISVIVTSYPNWTSILINEFFNGLIFILLFPKRNLFTN